MQSIFTSARPDRLRGSRASNAPGVALHIAIAASVIVYADRRSLPIARPHGPSLTHLTFDMPRLPLPTVHRVARAALLASPASTLVPPSRVEPQPAAQIGPEAPVQVDAAKPVDAPPSDAGPPAVREPLPVRAAQAPVLLGGFDRAVVPETARVSATGAAVLMAGFDRPVAQPAVLTVAPVARIDAPVEIVFKPVPAYTDEARRLRIEGTVVLDVEFTASSTVRVLRIVSGLGHGLDESASRAAADIRFNPARRGGVAADIRTTVQIVFRLT